MKFVNSDLHLTIEASDVDMFMSQLKAHGLNAGTRQVHDLIARKRDEVQGFFFIEGEASELIDPANVPDAPAATEAPAPTPKAADADVKPDFSPEAIQAAIDEKAAADALNPPAPKVDAAPAEPKPTKAKVKAVVKESKPLSRVKPVRKGTKIATGLEMLAGGTTEAALMGVCGDDPVDFVNRRVTKRGYGVKITDGSLSLVFPEGVTAIAYSGS